MNYELRIKRGATGGFSLLELLIYVAVLAIIVVVMASSFLSFSKGWSRATARSEVNSNLRFAMEKIVQDVKAAATTTIPGYAGAVSPTLTLTVGGSSVTYDVVGGVLRRGGEPITASTTLISNPSFLRLENANTSLATTTVSIRISLTAAYNSTGPDWQFSSSATTTATMR
ncbi:MAG: hypothetical protein HZA25_00835 [Candidatus Niyogibacteria bacterium]|nr:hypothetical protein [Candidatus Niyogibacteria bacterium]